MFLRFLAAGLLVSGCMPFASHAETFNTCTTFIDSLPATISTQGVYCLRKDLATAQSTGAAITVASNNVTIDCNGYKVGGLAAGLGTTASGIQALSQQNITVRNCNVRGFQAGVAIGGFGHLVENNNFNQNTSRSISVLGDGNLIRNNTILDTGGGSGNSTAYAILASDNTDIRDNTIDGVIGTDGSTTSVYGIRLTNGDGVAVVNNTVRNLAPTGMGKAYGVFSFGGQRIFLENNRVSLRVAVLGSIAYRCNSSFGAMRGNSSWSFETAVSGCLDSGGNVAY